MSKVNVEQQNTQKVSEYRFVSKGFDELSARELYELLRLRIDVFVVEQNCAYPECDGVDINANHVLLINGENELCGYARYYPGIEKNSFHIGRVAVRKSLRMEGLGKKLMDVVLTEIKNKKARKIEISAQLYLQRFYTDLGFIATGDAYKEDGIPHIKMIKTLHGGNRDQCC